jgi:DNA repair photolyase
MDGTHTKPTRIGRSTVEYRHASSILTKATGFADSFDYTLNPYSGCQFGCTYCYAAFFAKTDDLKDSWGQWIHVKENALDLLKRQRRKPLIDKTLYMSTVTDPYQPIEKDLNLTRAILEELLIYHRVRLMVQTRGPLVTRDIDLFKQFSHIQINMTITTDDDTVRHTFEPTCASIDQRLAAITEVYAAGIPTCITMTPLLPVADPVTFADRLLATGATRFIAQAFHMSKSRFVSSTGDQARALAKQMNWTEARYREVYRVLESKLPALFEGKDGFRPPWRDELPLDISTP